jgi:hypothetical protein
MILPAGHDDEQLVEPARLNWPAGQGKQDWPLVNVPAGQALLHALEPAALKVLELHALHDVEFTALLYCPAGQFRHPCPDSQVPET